MSLLATSLVLIFILKLRFPSRVPFTTVITNRYGSSTLSLYRKFEKLDFKTQKTQLDLNFLTLCKTHGIIPKFLQFKLYKSKVTRTLTYKQFQFKLLNYEINEKSKLLKNQQQALNETKCEFKNSTSFLDFHCLYNRMSRSNNKKISSFEKVHSKKLSALGISTEHKVNVEKVVINLSSRKLTKIEKEALSLGLSFALPKFNLNFIQHFFNFEKLLVCLKKIPCSLDWNNIVHNIASLAHNSYNDFPKYKFGFPKVPTSILIALKSLKSDKSIVITRPDKGRGTVILDKLDYIKKIEQILLDNSKFKSISEDVFKFITRLEDRLARLLRKLLKFKVINKETFNFLFSSGSSPGILYGLPKTHKPGTPLRPVLSTIGTFNYNLAKYFVPIIEPLTTNQYTLKNSFEFVKDIKCINFENKVMASFDVESLFTNIPLNETINIITNGLFKDSTTFMNFKRKEFKDLLELAVKESPFQFNNKFYTQVDGVAMGSCLGPTLANTFLCHHETKWLADCPEHFKPLYYKRYVDDTFLLFNDVEQIPLFLQYLNSKHSNIKFTYEVENNCVIPFLDVLVRRVGNSCTTSVYRKPTFTGLGTNYLSFIPSLFKINAVKTLLYRCFTISSDWFSFHKEIDFLTNFFLNNGYPRSVIENCVSTFLNNIFQQPPTREDKHKDIHYFKLPYYGYLSLFIRKKLDNLLKTHYPDKKFKFVFTNSYTLKSFFPFKDRISPSLLSNIVYQFQCPTCKCRYIGETSRNLFLRVAEHMGVSSRTGRPISRPSHSPIREHSLALKHSFSMEDFKILNKPQFPIDTKIIESLYIITTSPLLNNHSVSFPLNIQYKTVNQSFESETI